MRKPRLRNPKPVSYVDTTAKKAQDTRRAKHSKTAHRLVAKAETLMDDWSLSSCFSVEELADQLEVSKRSLYRAFHDCLGTGPYEVFLSKKLDAFRQQLLQGSYYRGKITDAASSSGFTQFGRLAKRYKEHFGELPSETARRREGQ